MNKYFKYSLWALLFVIVYVLSSGPILALRQVGYLPEFVVYIYLPLVWLGLICRPIGYVLLWYVLQWIGFKFSPF